MSAANMSADSELTSVLSRRQAINEALDEGKPVSTQQRAKRGVYAEFHEFSRKQIKDYEQTFRKYDEGGDGYLDLMEVKRMMERLSAPQTHLSLKAMIKEVDEDGDDRISFREFLLIYRKAAAGELAEDSGLGRLAALTEIDVDEVGVTGAKDFFEAKIKEVSRSCKFEEEIREEQETRRREDIEREQRRVAFQQKASLFQ